jgi:hypothetical protein
VIVIPSEIEYVKERKLPDCAWAITSLPLRMGFTAL